MNEQLNRVAELRKALKRVTDPKLIEIYNRHLALALIDLRYAKLKGRVTDAGFDYTKWEEWARSLYDISETFLVKSKAKEWKEDMSWQFDDEISCLEKIEQLIGYKYYDHFVREA